MIREQREKLQIYEFLYNRLPFSDEEQKELEVLREQEELEAQFEQQLTQIKLDNIEVMWHCSFDDQHSEDIVNVMLATDYCYYLFVLKDLKGTHSINAFNILVNGNNDPVINLHQSKEIYEHFRRTLIDEGKYQRPIILKYVVMNPRFEIRGKGSEVLLRYDDLPYYLKAIESAAKIRKKYRRPL
ncbi:MAG TPA: hypothetical protein K8V35_02695 [Aliicoccus persicus]|uniref:Nuclease-related domain-containing protein n=1 Tax=Aliicoccus persicus TaxID=930138 RepID=A0A921B639_9STAP|nr:hypothetical protein [Aliicoccus persicus]